jgi:hypothetical protein
VKHRVNIAVERRAGFGYCARTAMKLVATLFQIKRRMAAIAAVALLFAFPSLTTLSLWAGESVPGADGGKLEPLALELPPPSIHGTPRDLQPDPKIEPLSSTPRPPLMVPAGVTNVALGKPVTGSVRPLIGDLNKVTDGRKAPEDSDTVELRRGTQFVQVDLGGEHVIAAIAIWHDHRVFQVMRDVVIQVSNDPEFAQAQTLFNNDTDNTSGHGAGTDREYFETFEGKLLNTKGVKGRYVRSYLRGSSLNPLNCWQEIEVYALPLQ